MGPKTRLIFICNPNNPTGRVLETNEIERIVVMAARVGAYVQLPGRYAIGHVRYSTAGESSIREAQPFLAESAQFQIAVGNNGNLTNHAAIRAELEGHGSIFQSTMDTEVFVHLLARARGTLEGNRNWRH